jgi:uncharacterized protein with HEPN domain
MTRRSPAIRLGHVLAAADAIAQFTAGVSFEDYANDRKTRAAVERQFMIIGEALRAAEHMDPTIAQEISEFRDILDFRNVLVHGYSTIYDEAVWVIIHEKLPLLRTEVTALLARY